MYNGPSGPRTLLTTEISSAPAAVAANIAPTAKQIILRIMLIRPVGSSWTQHLFGRATDAEGTERFRVWVRRSFHQIVFDVATEFLAEKIGALFPEAFTARCAD